VHSRRRNQLPVRVSVPLLYRLLNRVFLLLRYLLRSRLPLRQADRLCNQLLLPQLSRVCTLREDQQISLPPNPL
jgi:hypothetical protein